MAVIESLVLGAEKFEFIFGKKLGFGLFAFIATGLFCFIVLSIILLPLGIQIEIIISISFGLATVNFFNGIIRR